MSKEKYNQIFDDITKNEISTKPQQKPSLIKKTVQTPAQSPKESNGTKSESNGQQSKAKSVASRLMKGVADSEENQEDEEDFSDEEEVDDDDDNIFSDDDETQTKESSTNNGKKPPEDKKSDQKARPSEPYEEICKLQAKVIMKEGSKEETVVFRIVSLKNYGARYIILKDIKPPITTLTVSKMKPFESEKKFISSDNKSSAVLAVDHVVQILAKSLQGNTGKVVNAILEKFPEYKTFLDTKKLESTSKRKEASAPEVQPVPKKSKSTEQKIKPLDVVPVSQLKQTQQPVPKKKSYDASKISALNHQTIGMLTTALEMCSPETAISTHYTIKGIASTIVNSIFN